MCIFRLIEVITRRLELWNQLVVVVANLAQFCNTAKFVFEE